MVTKIENPMLSPTYLHCCTLIGKRRAEEHGDDVRDSLSHILLQHDVCVLPIEGRVTHLEWNTHVLHLRVNGNVEYDHNFQIYA